MSEEQLATKFAPPERTPQETLKSQIQMFEDIPLLNEHYDAVMEIVVVLNKQREIVFFNKNLVTFLQPENKQDLYGLRPGEALNCKYAHLEACGCGTSEFCSQCGAVRAIQNGLNNMTDMQECRIIQANSAGVALDLLVQVTPFISDGERFVIFTAKDISSEKRRRVLERIFLHDISNTVAGLKLITQTIESEQIKDLDEVKSDMLFQIEQIMDEINAQQMLLAAESMDLVTRSTMNDTSTVLQKVTSHYKALAEDRKVRLVSECGVQTTFNIDRSILVQVLGNMVKNAIEASGPGETVTIGCETGGDRLLFTVHNPAAMDKSVQLQLFQRSFSTKGTNRGIGTYSMKLLSERYLNGNVSFQSSSDKGTTFTASYPLN